MICYLANDNADDELKMACQNMLLSMAVAEVRQQDLDTLLDWCDKVG